MLVDQPTFVKGDPLEQLDDGRWRVNWTCPHCQAINEGCGLCPFAGFDCGACGAAVRVAIRLEDMRP